MSRSIRGSSEFDESASFEDSIDDGFCEVGIVKHLGPRSKGLVGGEDHRSFLEIAAVDDLEEDVRGVLRVGEVTDLVDDEDASVGVGLERGAESAFARGFREFFDQVVGFTEEGGRAVLNGPVRDRDGEVGLPDAGRAAEDQVTCFADQLGSEEGPEQRPFHRGLKGEIEVLESGEEREARPVDRAPDAGLSAMMTIGPNDPSLPGSRTLCVPDGAS